MPAADESVGWQRSGPAGTQQRQCWGGGSVGGGAAAAWSRLKEWVGTYARPGYRARHIN